MLIVVVLVLVGLAAGGGVCESGGSDSDGESDKTLVCTNCSPDSFSESLFRTY